MINMKAHTVYMVVRPYSQKKKILMRAAHEVGALYVEGPHLLENTISYPGSLSAHHVLVEIKNQEEAYQVIMMAGCHHYGVGEILFNAESSTGVELSHLIEQQEDIALSVEQVPHYTMNDEALVVGDIHGCYGHLRALLRKAGFLFAGDEITYYPMQLVLNGDLVNKGPSSADVIRFVYSNLGHPDFKVVLGNHELYIMQHIDDVKPNSRYFDYLPTVRANRMQRNMFIAIYKESVPYLVSHSRTSAVHHSPCDYKYVGKSDPISIQRQIHLPSIRGQADKQNTSVDEVLYPYFNGQPNWPLVVNGHVTTKHPLLINNRAMIDTGAFLGCYLTAAHVMGSTCQFISTENVNSARNTMRLNPIASAIQNTKSSVRRNVPHLVKALA
jgi:hypothetical protein